MEGRKLWVVALLSCLFLAGASIAMFRTVSANKAVNSLNSAPVRQESQASPTLHFSGNYPQLKFNNSVDLAESAEAAITNGRPVSMIKADLNGDGFKDLLALYSAPGHSEVRVRLNTQDQVLLNPVSVPVGVSDPTAFVAGDFNVDGNEDLAVGGRDGSISLLYGDGKGGFTAGPTFQAGGSVSGLASIDLDRDGLKDLLVLDQASAALKIYINQGDLSLVTPRSIDLSSLGNLQAIQAADFNIDFYNDVAVAGDQGVAVLFGDGKGNLSKAHKIGSVGPVAGMVVSDLNADQIPDIAVAGLSDVTVFNSHRDGHFSRGRSYNAGSGITAITAGVFDSDRFNDLAVADSANHISVLLNNKGRSFSDPMPMDIDGGAVALLTGFDKRAGIDSIAAARKTGGITVAVTSGGTITVTTQLDENDCPFCDVAGLEAFKTSPTGHPGGNDGIALREAITAINNDSVLHGSTNWTISFAGISQAANAAHGPQGPFHCQHLNQGTTWLCIIGANAMGVPNGFGDLPPIDSPGTTIDGSLVNHTSDGVNNPDGPQTIIRGNNTTRLLVLTSNATNSTIKNLNLANSLGDALVVQGSGDTITNNVIGLDCDSSSTFGPLNDGNGGAGIVFQSGSVNETVTNNIIGNNGNGIVINGVSQSTAIPQANEFSGNLIGLGKDLRHLDLPPLSPMVCSFCGTYTPSPRGNANDGILIQNGAVGNTIEHNTISNNGAANATIEALQTVPGAGNGIEIMGDITSDAIIQNNKIGTDPNGVSILDAVNAPIGNLGDGIFIGSMGNPKFNQVTLNVISGNGSMPTAATARRRSGDARVKPQLASTTGGVVIQSADFNAQFNVVTTNKIGTNVNGSVQLPNLEFGVLISGDGNNNTIGGTTSTLGNVISGNGMAGMTSFGPGVVLQDAADNNLFQNNLIGPNALGTGAPTDLANPSNPVSNKGGGMVIIGTAFANRIIANTIAFNSTLGTASGIFCASTGSFNLFSQNLIFLNPANNPPTIPAIVDTGAGQEGLANGEISAATPPAPTSLIKIDSGTTVTSTGDTTITGTADFIDNIGPSVASINKATVEVFVSQRGSASNETLSEAQAFLGTVTSFQVDPHVLSGHVVDWSAHLTIPAPFLNPVQTPVLFLTATITTGDGSTSPLSRGFVPEFVSSGGGGGCSLAPSPTVVNFSNSTVGHTTTQNLVITNTGSTSVTISAVTLSQTGSLFAIGTLGTLPATIAPTNTFTIPVNFTPTATSAVTASITVANNCSTLTVPVAGSGTTSNISVIPTSLNFGNVNVGQTATQSFTIINFGTGTLNITGLTIANSATTKFTIVSNPAPTTVGGTSTLTVFVQFAPTSAGAVTDTLTVASSDVVHPSIAVALSGTGVSTTPPSVIVNQPSGGQVVAAGSAFTVGFAATSPSLPGTFLVKLSTDGGVTFPFSLGGGTATSGINTFSAIAPSSVSTSSAVVQVSVTDSASLTGTGLSSVFTIGTPPVILSLKFTMSGKIKVTGTNIQDGGSAVIGTETWPLVDVGGGLFVVKAFQTGSLGHVVGDVVPSGHSATVSIRNPGGLTSAGVTATRP